MTPRGTVEWGQPTATTQQSMMTAMATAHISQAQWQACTTVLPKMPPFTQVTMTRASFAVVHSAQHSAYLYDMYVITGSTLSVGLLAVSKQKGRLTCCQRQVCAWH